MNVADGVLDFIISPGPPYTHPRGLVILHSLGVGGGDGGCSLSFSRRKERIISLSLTRTICGETNGIAQQRQDQLQDQHCINRVALLLSSLE